MIICVFCAHGSVFRIARSAVVRSAARRSIRWLTRSWRCQAHKDPASCPGRARAERTPRESAGAGKEERLCPCAGGRQLIRAFEEITLDKNIKHNIEIVVDRLVVKPGIEKRLSDSIETVMGLSNGLMLTDRRCGMKTAKKHDT